MIRAYFAATGPGHPAAMESVMSSSVYKNILWTNARLYIPQLKLGRNGLIQQNNEGPDKAHQQNRKIMKENKRKQKKL